MAVSGRALGAAPQDRFTVAGMLRANVAAHGDKPMFRVQGRTTTWSEHFARACAVSSALAAEGVGPGDRVAFLDRNSLAYFEVLFAGALMGAVNVAVNWRLSPGEMAAVIDDARANVLVVEAEFLPCLAKMDSGLATVRRVVVLGDPGEHTGDGGASDSARRVGYEDWLAGPAETDPGHCGAPDEVSLQLYTSGTTGVPKGVMLTNANLAVGIEKTAVDCFGIESSAVSLVAMPLFHIGGSGWALMGMSRGGTSVILRDIVPDELVRLVEAERITTTFVVPAVLMSLLACPATATADLSSLETIFYGASPIAEDVLTRCITTFRCHFSQVYGMTETTGAIIQLPHHDHDPDGPRRHLLRAAGKPLPGVEVRIVDPDSGADAAIGAVGELLTRSPLNMLGYWDKPDETRTTISADGWLRTGDAAYADEDGYIYLHDRIKDMVVSGGENIYPAEVENVLLAHGALCDAAVIGVPHDRFGEAVKAIVVLAPDVDADHAPAAADIISFCRGRLAHYKCPSSVDFVPSLPRNPSGKILKRELREPYWQGLERRVH